MNELKKDISRKAKQHGIDLVESSMQIESMGVDFQVAFAEDTTGQKRVCRIKNGSAIISEQKMKPIEWRRL